MAKFKVFVQDIKTGRIVNTAGWTIEADYAEEAINKFRVKYAMYNQPDRYYIYIKT